MKSLILAVTSLGFSQAAAAPLPGTLELDANGDRAAQMVEGIHRFFERETADVAKRRAVLFTPEVGDFREWQAQRQPKAEELRRRLGLEAVAAEVRLEAGSPVGTAAGRLVVRVEWPVIRGVRGEGLYVAGDDRVVIVLPDCGTTPEQSFGLAPGLPPERQWANRLAADGASVLAMALIDRRTGAASPDGRQFHYSQREVLWRAGFEMGRTMVGYEIQKTLAAGAALRNGRPAATVSLVGSGDGGYLALLAGASSPEIASVAIDGGFTSLDTLWEQPVDRTVFGVLRSFGLAELASLVAPRPLAVLDASWPEVRITDRGAPGVLRAPTEQELRDSSALLTPERIRVLWPSQSPAWPGGFSRHRIGDTWLVRAVPPPSVTAAAPRQQDVPASERARAFG